MAPDVTMGEDDLRMITCRELDGFLCEYVAGDLRGRRRQRFERHLAVCPACVRYLEQYRLTIRLGQQAFVDADLPAPDEVPRELIHAILDSRRKRRPPTGG